MLATLGGGCFWCTEAIFKRLKGVSSVTAGHSGVPFAECTQIEFDSKVLPYEKILDVFFATHDPTSLNRQGNDVGTQYRSVIFYHSEEQKKIAEKLKLPSFVTEIVPFESFEKAQESNQNYYDRNKDYLYCQYVINPKIQKLFKEYSNDIKDEYKTP